MTETMVERPRRAVESAAWENRALLVAQQVKSGWFALQYRIGAGMIPDFELPDEGRARMPGPRPVLRALGEVLRRDRRNVADGHYPAAALTSGSATESVATAIRFFRDLPKVDKRRRDGDGQEVFREDAGAGLPRYYRQNFHFQSDGYLSRESARLYDHQVEVLFGGAADAMRRQALVPLVREIRRRAAAGDRVASLRMGDLACGTARFVASLKHAYPRLPVLGVDLSPHYLAEAGHKLRRFSWLKLAQGNVEALPIGDGALDLASCIFLFHELPRKVRPIAAREFARVLRPGGVMAFMDSLQHGDVPGLDGLLDFFPVAYHEPYYADYLDDDLSALFRDAGFVVEAIETHFLARLMILRRL